MEFRRFTITHGDYQVPKGLLSKALHLIDSTEMKGRHVVDFGEIVGFSDVVPVTDEDEFYEMARGNRQYASRFLQAYLVPRG